MKIKSGEVQTLQKEYEAVNSTVLQLEKQKGERVVLIIKLLLLPSLCSTQ